VRGAQNCLHNLPHDRGGNYLEPQICRKVIKQGKATNTSKDRIIASRLELYHTEGQGKSLWGKGGELDERRLPSKKIIRHGLRGKGGLSRVFNSLGRVRIVAVWRKGLGYIGDKRRNHGRGDRSADLSTNRAILSWEAY